MFSAPNQQNQRSNANIIGDKKFITFTEWKSLKYDNNKNTENNGGLDASGDSKNRFKNSFNDQRNYISGFSKNIFCNSANAGFLQSNNFNGVNNSNKFNMRVNDFLPVNKSYNNFGPSSNNLNHANNIGFNSLSIRFNNSKGLSDFTSTNEYQNCYRNNRYGNNDFSNKNPVGLSNFFTSDCVYSQRDMMQKPLPNPFRNDYKAKQLLQQFERSRYSKNENEKNQTIAKNSNYPNNVNQNLSYDSRQRTKEPEVYIYNPKAKIDGKSYVPKPKAPEQNLEITKEEKKQQWKEYRQAMKPFKNRDFYNAKRVVQRLGKKSPSELDDKELLRLKNAKELIHAYKARLTEKYSNNYVKAEDSSDKLGEVYVLKKALPN